MGYVYLLQISVWLESSVP